MIRTSFFLDFSQLGVYSGKARALKNKHSLLYALLSLLLQLGYRIPFSQRTTKIPQHWDQQ